jgi:hypothetical protein
MDASHWWCGVDIPGFWREMAKLTGKKANVLTARIDLLRMLHAVPRAERFFLVLAPNEPCASAWPFSAPPRGVHRMGRALAGLSILRPDEPGRVPVQLVHRLWGSERNWDQRVRELQADEAILKRYQVWTFGYSHSDCIAFSALRLRRAIRRAREIFDPAGRDEGFDRVIIGHTLGGLVAKMMAQSTGTKRWRTVSTKHPNRMFRPVEDVRPLRGTSIYERLPEVRRLIFIASTYRGNSLARGGLVILGTGICRVTGGAGDGRRRLLGCNDTGFLEPEFRLSAPTSVSELKLGSPLLTALGELGIDPTVGFHSIIPSVGPEMGDGIVPLASAKSESAASELLVRAGCVCVEERDVIRETARSLAEHLRIFGENSSLASPDSRASCGTQGDRGAKRWPWSRSHERRTVHRVAIVGGGCAGRRAAESLRTPDMQVRLLYRRNRHVSSLSSTRRKKQGVSGSLRSRAMGMIRTLIAAGASTR